MDEDYKGKMSMPFADRELEARLLRETHELSERRLKLESAIRAVDAASKLHMEKAALRDIEAYRHLQRLHLSHAHEIRKLSDAAWLIRGWFSRDTAWRIF